MTKKYRIKSKARFVTFAAFLIIFVITSFTTIMGFNTVDGTSMEEYFAINVNSGDTLWSIACKYGPEDQDVRKTVDAICELNEISANDLVAGEKILVPVY